MAGGRGTRLAERTEHLPKPLVPVAGMPILERELAVLRSQGFTDILLTVSYLGSAIRDYFGDGSKCSPVTGEPFGVQIEYFQEQAPLGNAGALLKLRPRIHEPFLLLNADVLFDVDLRRMVDFHKRHGGLATLLTHPNAHPYDSGLIVASEDGRVLQWLSKEDDRPAYYSNRVNAGLHILSPEALDRAGIDASLAGTLDPATGKRIKVDLDRQILKPLAGTGLLFCYDSPEYVKDMGTPERLAQAELDCRDGLVAARNLRRPQRAVFLDRDGTLNRFAGYVRSLADFELLPGAAEAVRKLNEAGWLCIVATNQPVVARGELSQEGLKLIHQKLETELGHHGAYVDALYACMHHPDRGFPGEVQELKVDCCCRKPKPGMLHMAAKRYNIDLASSWMVGDSWRDVECGIAAGTHTCLLTGEGTEPLDRKTGQEMTCSSLLEAVNRILQEGE